MPDNKPSDTVSRAEYEALQRQIAELNGKLSMVQAAPPVPPVAGAPDGSHDLDTYANGEYKHRATGKTFKLKVVKDDEHGKPFKLKSKEHFFEAGTVPELEAHFHGDFSKFAPSDEPEPKK